MAGLVHAGSDQPLIGPATAAFHPLELSLPGRNWH